MKLGLEVFLEQRIDLVQQSRIGLIVNPSSVDSTLEHAADLLHNHPGIELTALFGPQHGIRGETQDNMIEWQSFTDQRTGLPAYSLYGQSRSPLTEMLEYVDALVFDVQDVGTRVYTFIYTMALAMEAARDHGKRFLVLDRPNPINGYQVEGNIHEPEFRSFVGMFPIPMRHGLTVGELALLFNREFGIGCQLEVVPMFGWNRRMFFEDSGLPWIMPSPNIPTVDTAVVYPGTVMVEGTNLSEGRGTTRPFEIIGAPFIDAYRLVEELNREGFAGVKFRPVHFQPTFHKFAGEVCGGCQVHVIDRHVFKPVLTGVAIISTIRRLYPHHFRWKQPPYEYVFDRLPFDVITGTETLRRQIESGAPVNEIEASWIEPLERFRDVRGASLLYD